MTPERFHVQADDGTIISVPGDTTFALVERDDGHAVIADLDVAGLDIALFTGSESECREYLAHLPHLLQQAGIPTVLTQHYQSREQAAAAQDDAVRWGGGS